MADYSTYLGGDTVGNAIAVSGGSAFVVGGTASTAFPTTVGASRAISRATTRFVVRFTHFG